MKLRTVSRCSECDAESPRWLGRCTECDAWGTVAEVSTPTSQQARATATPTASPVPITEVASHGTARRITGIGELDRVLGGGIVPGSVTLLAGEPGIGKSTLLLQALANLAADGARCLLVGAEESPEQVRLRAERLGALVPELLLVSEASVPRIAAHVAASAPDILAVDSIQAVVDPELGGAGGSVSQVRACAAQLVGMAKERAMATLLVGHVTKEGTLAGPRALEHVVDTVLSFEGDRHHSLRLVRALKHRFGPTHEVGVFEMAESGLVDVADPSALFLADRRADAPGSVVVPVLDGARPLLVEVQALVAAAPTPLPRRSATGIDSARLALLLAVLEHHVQTRGGLRLSHSDVYANVAGGVRVAEPGADLGVVLAIASALLNQPVAAGAVVVGEVGLGGEVRQVAQAARRLQEAARLGFTRVIGPSSLPRTRGLTVIPADTVYDALEAGLSSAGLSTRAERPVLAVS